MAKYLIEVSYTREGLEGLLADGGTKRRDVARAAIESVGGSLESFYFAFGETDAYVVADLPDNITVAGLALRISGSGAMNASTVVLLTPEEIDEATEISPNWTPPGA